MKIKDFSPAGYKTLVQGFLDRGYRVRDFVEADPLEPHLVLRHDIDMSLNAAVEIAQVENELGVTAHYFVLLRTEMYNIFSKNGLKAVETILSLGHKVGLHFDASLYDQKEFEDAAEWEVGCLQCATGTEVEMISFHRPEKYLLGRKEPLAGRRHAYQPRYFKEMAYCSDSRGHWGYGQPQNLKAVEKGHALQLLTHPIWWSLDDYQGPVSRLDQFANERHSYLQKELSKNCEPFRNAHPNLGDDN